MAKEKTNGKTRGEKVHTFSGEKFLKSSDNELIL